MSDATELAFPWITVAIVAPGLAALWPAASARLGAIVALLLSTVISAACAIAVLREHTLLTESWSTHAFGTSVVAVDALSAITMVLVGLVALAIFVAAPAKDLADERGRGMLLGIAGALACYAADNVIVLAAGFAAAGMVAGGFTAQRRLAAVSLGLSVVALSAAIWLLVQAAGAVQHPLSLRSLREAHVDGHTPAMVLLMLALCARKGIIPLHTWLVDGFERGPMLATGLGVNFHLGAFILLRLGLTLFSHELDAVLPAIAHLALFTAAAAALFGLVAVDPRRRLGFVIVSQSAFVLIGLQSSTMEGIAGGLVLQVVVALATTGLLLTTRAVQERVGSDFGAVPFLGLGQSAPRLAVFFIVSALSLIGLPGTLGFCGEDLLLHGVLEEHPYIGLALPLATALNAMTLYRLFSSFFTGRRTSIAVEAGDALPRERFVLAAIVVVLVGTGLMPTLVTSAREATVHSVLLQSGRSTHHHAG